MRRTPRPAGPPGAGPTGPPGRGSEPATGRPTVTVYTRRSCKLCAAAEAVVADVATGRADITLVDIDTDRELHERYTVRVPVVAVDGEEIAEYHLDPDELRAVLDLRS